MNNGRRGFPPLVKSINKLKAKLIDCVKKKIKPLRN